MAEKSDFLYSRGFLFKKNWRDESFFDIHVSVFLGSSVGRASGC